VHVLLSYEIHSGDLLPGQQETGQEAELLFVFILSGNRFKVFGFKDLAAVQTLHIIDAVTPGNNFGTVMVTHTN
jgi:hypothetical protein